MHDQMEAIKQAKESNERLKLLQKHSESMRDGMEMMREMAYARFAAWIWLKWNNQAPPNPVIATNGRLHEGWNDGKTYKHIDMMLMLMEQMIEHNDAEMAAQK